jgi:rod shape-determining protein MreD
MWYILPFLVPGSLVYLGNGPAQLLAIYGSLPELALIALIYYGNSRGAMLGQLAGLAIGLTIDFLSAAPLGFFTFIFTLAGYAAGKSKGKIYVDPIFTPLLMIAVGILTKALLVFILAGVFGYPEVRSAVFGSPFLIQLVYSLVLAPVVFALLSLLDRVFPKKRRGGYQD